MERTHRREERTEKISDTYERVECSLVFKRQTCKRKKDLSKSEILIYIAEEINHDVWECYPAKKNQNS